MAPPWKEIDEGEQPKVPSRKPGEDGQGSLGTTIPLITNFFRVSFDLPDVTLYHFHVKIDDSSDRVRAAPAKTGIIGAAPAPPKNNKPTKKKKRQGRKKGKKPIESDDDELDYPASDHSLVSLNKSLMQDDGGGMKDFRRRIPKPKQRKIFGAFCKEHQHLLLDKNLETCLMAYDGEANSVSSRKPSQFKIGIPVSYEFVFEDKEEQRTKSYTITFQLVSFGKLQTLLSKMKNTTHISTMPTALFQMLEIIFNYEKTLLFESVMRNQFFSQEKEMFGRNFGLGSMKEGVRGFSCSLRPVQGFDGWKDPGKFMLNIDVAHAPFYCCQPLLEFLRRFTILVDTSRRLCPQTIKCIEEHIVKNNIKVVTTHTQIPFTYVVKGVSQYTPSEKYLDDGKGKETVAQYMFRKHGYTVKFPKMQCLEVGNRGAVVPIEVCSIAPNQRAKGELSDDEMKQFVTQAAIRPNERCKLIQDIIEKNNFKNDPYLKQLGATVSEDFQKVKGRILPSPVVHMAGRIPNVAPKGGVWDIRKYKFLVPAALDHWAVINFTGEDCDIDKFIASMRKLAGDRGMKTAPPLTIVHDANILHADTVLHDVKKNHNTVKYILCVKNNEKRYYGIIKTTAERDLGVATNCVLFKNVRNCEDFVVGNLLMKINVQLGGVNHSSSYPTHRIFSEIFSEAILVMGADANHPPAGNSFTPSVVAVVGSTNQDASKYAVEVRAQQHRRDMITEIKVMTKNLLRQYLKSRKVKPERIVMYRDGVSESEFETVLCREMMAMRQACTEVQKDGLYKPAITFICVQKRHSTRMFCENPKDADGLSGNVPAGTVMDTVVIQSFADFYLCSQKGIMGTSKPAHYIVLWDDSDFSMDQLQLLTNSLCHNYSRCSRAVSIPAPVYYAHLAADRGKDHLAAFKVLNRDDWTEAIVRGQNGSFEDEKLARAVTVDIDNDLSRKLYYA